MAKKASIASVTIISILLIAVAVAGIKLLDKNELTFTGAQVACQTDEECGTTSCPSGSSGSCQNKCVQIDGTKSCVSCTPSCTENACTDGQDNDNDGKTDCADIDCNSQDCIVANGTALCQALTCKIQECKIGFWDIDKQSSNGCEYQCTQDIAGVDETGAENKCNDNKDNDCDAKIDCADPTCDVQACSVPNGSGTCANSICSNVECGSGFYDIDGNPANGCEYQCTITNGGVEVCDGKDNNCDGTTDGITVCTTEQNCGIFGNVCVSGQSCVNGVCTGVICLDNDDDFYNATAGGKCGTVVDCNDNDEDINPGATETCNKLDDDCDASIDETFDVDADKFYNSTLCSVSYAANVLDTNDADSSIYFGAPDVCDRKDNNGDGVIDNFNNGTSVNATKCQCYNGGLPKAKEDLNGIDDTCDGILDSEERDSDNDGFAVYQGDCNDNNAAINPKAKEICIDNRDNNCNEKIDSATEGCGQQANGTSLIGQTTSTPELGDGVCEAGETAENAAVDCGCPDGEELVGTACTPIEAIEEVAVCGNEAREGEELCDGSDDVVCPGACQSDCSCAWLPNNGVCQSELGETADISPADCAPKFGGLAILLAVFLTVLGSAGGYWFFKVRVREKLSDMADLQDLNPETTSTAEAPQSIESYVNQTMSMGYSVEQVRGALVSQGWDADIVDEKLESAGVDLGKLQDATAKYGVDTVHDDVSKVEKYVSFGLKEGYDPTQIKTALTSAGWDEETVESVFSEHPDIKSDLKGLAKTQGVDNPEAKPEKIKKFAKSAMKKGHTLKQVKKTLSDAGWEDAVVFAQLPKV